MSVQTKLIKLFCQAQSELFDEEKLLQQIEEGISQKRIVIFYYARLLDTDDVDEQEDYGQPYWCIENNLDKANLTYLSHLFCKEKNNCGEYRVMNRDADDLKEAPKELFLHALKLGNEEKANRVYSFSLLPDFDFD
jgi:hypothetical protein